MKSFLTKKAVVHEIELDGETMRLNFYPIRVRRLLYVRDMASGLAKALGVLFNRNPFEDFKRTEQEFGDEGKVSVVEPPGEEVIRLRAKQKSAAIETVTNVLLAEENLKVVARLIMDSLRDEYPRGEEHDAEEFLDNVDLDVLPQFLKGLAKANKKVLGPLAPVLEEKLAGLTLVTDPAPTTEESESPDTEPTPPQDAPFFSTSPSGRDSSKEEAQTDQ